MVGPYHDPPEKAVVSCVDEKSQIQALDRSHPVLPMMPGMPERRTQVHLHFTPTGSSWSNQVERWFGLLTDQMIRRGAHKSVQAPEADIRARIAAWNDDPKPFVWKKTAEEILDFLKRNLQRISGAGH